MTIVSKKVSVYGDSTSIAVSPGLDRAARIYAYNSAKFGSAGYNNCAHGGHSLYANYNTNVFKNDVAQTAFPTYIANTDDGDIIVIILGGNDPVTSSSFQQYSY